jgi:3-hydroxyacyl-[acyl-carrier-protein] dehydratase
MAAETTLTFAPDHPVFAGHFPGQPMVPGVMLLDAALQAAQQAMQTAGETDTHAQAGHCQITAAKFLSPVLPGETLTISCTHTGPGRSRFEIRGVGRAVASGSFIFTPSP